MTFISRVLVAVIFVLAILNTAAADPTSGELSGLLPQKIAGFQQVSPIRPAQSLIKQGLLAPELAKASQRETSILAGEVEYKTPSGKQLLVELVQFHKDTDAYSVLSFLAREIRNAGAAADIFLDGQFGTAYVRSPNGLAFVKGTTFVRIDNPADSGQQKTETDDLARLLADNTDKGDGDIPVLIRHLPDWQNAQKQAVYLSGVKSLSPVAPSQPVLSTVNPEADADAVVATYGQAKMLLIEFNTPQLAGEIDRQLIARIQELKGQNQAVPTAYRRVGNYGVFVFDAASEQAANELIDQIKYEQVVQWLGDNPYWFKEAQRRYTETTLGVLVSVVKASGLTLVACFGLGGLIGGMLFMRRRAQISADAFSDAGGMLRLNLDEMTPQTNPARLLTDRN